MLVAFAGLLIFDESTGPWPALALEEQPTAHRDHPPRFASGFVNNGKLALVHATTAVIDPQGQLRSYWYGGSREGATDVEIYTALFDETSNTWTDQQSVINRQAATSATGSYVRKLGNPVALTRANGEVWLFYVAVPLGGWAYSAINLAKSYDGGATFAEHSRLIASPFLNRSTMVKSAPSYYEDGTLALPAHYELHTKHVEILRLDDAGKVIGKQRINGDHPSLQPQLFTDDDITVAVIRPGQYLDPGRRVLIATSTDRGRTWSETQQIDIANPNAAVAGIRTSQGFIFVYNDHVGKRDQLSLGFAPRADATWQEIYLLEDEVDTRKHEFRFSYPWLVRQDGEYHVFYTWNRERIKHVVFNEAWLDRQIEAIRG